MKDCQFDDERTSMPFQNRVNPYGEIVATPARGHFMGNRGILHDEHRRLGRARWRTKAWITCVLDWKAVKRKVMAPGAYTELIFLDEATACAAGHRPCAECRRADFNAFVRAWAEGTGWTADTRPKVGDIDARLHAERVEPRTRRKITFRAPLDGLPDGTMVIMPDIAETPWLILGGGLLPWSMQGYGAMRERGSGMVEVLTPRSTVAAFAAGYRAHLHLSAYEPSRSLIMDIIQDGP